LGGALLRFRQFPGSRVRTDKSRLQPADVRIARRNGSNSSLITGLIT
jgi:hypothetical protein